jgi:hypothetical protein
MRKFPLVGVLVLAVQGCASLGQVTLTEAGNRVVVSSNAPTSECQNKGSVVGEARGGSTTSAGEHTRRAVDDARNKAGALGANYLQTTQPQLIQSQFGPTGATVMGTAFSCKDQASASASSSAPTP